MNQNYSKKMLFGLALAVIALVGGISYAYFSATLQNFGVRETSVTLAELGSLKLTASEATYTSGGQYPGDIALQKIVVEPVSVGVGIYEIDLNATLPSVFGSDVEIKLYKSLDNTEVTITDGELTQNGAQFSREDSLNTNGLTPVYEGVLQNGENILYQEDFEVINQSGLKVRENSTSTAYAKYTFYLVYIYKNNGRQNAQMGKTFSGTISGKMIQEKMPSESHTVSFVYCDDGYACDITKAHFENRQLVSLKLHDFYTLEEIGPVTDSSMSIEEIVENMMNSNSYYYDSENPSYFDTSVGSYSLSDFQSMYSMWETYNGNSYLESIAHFDGDLVLYHTDSDYTDYELYPEKDIYLVSIHDNTCESVKKLHMCDLGYISKEIVYDCTGSVLQEKNYSSPGEGEEWYDSTQDFDYYLYSYDELIDYTNPSVVRDFSEMMLGGENIPTYYELDNFISEESDQYLYRIIQSS
ncbi:MAG: hypothetical protein IJ743_02760 [Bacilli bacterium]|nr:hypothetical protein [Bacilli bacterium]MBR1817342.1 hypothetical protein [Bacilli bacterium]